MSKRKEEKLSAMTEFALLTAPVTDHITHPENGSALIAEDYIHIWLHGTLESMRSKKFNKYKSVRRNNILKRREQEAWYAKLLSLGVQGDIKKLFDQCLLNGFKLDVGTVIHRKIPIRDKNNWETGFNHAIIDGWKNGGIIKDDSHKYCEFNITQLTKKESADYERDLVFIMLSQSKVPYKG